MENIVIGSGPAGRLASLELGKLGKEVTLIEKEKLGGTCLNSGCIPTKSYYQNAKVLNELKKGESFGINGDFTFDFSKVKARKDKVVG